MLNRLKTLPMGAIRVAHISTEEPAAASEHMLIFVRVPLQQGIGDDCFAVSAQSGSESGYRGFYALDFAKLRVSYDDKKGLLLRIPASVNDSGNEKRVGDIKVRISRKNDNSVTTEK